MLRHIICCVIVLFLLTGCDTQQQSSPTQAPEKELLIYCGTAMAKAIRELGDIFEQQEHCIVKIIKEGSGVLYHSIQINQVGDLYLPGAESYIDQAIADGIVSEDSVVGFNHAVMVVAKDNPLNISTDLSNFTNADYRTALGDPACCSIGKTTQIILQQNGLYQQALKQAIFVLPDSRALTAVIVENKADLMINWLSATRHKNGTIVDVLPLENGNSHPIALRIGLLNTSQQQPLALRFMTLANTSEGQAIFSRYGFARISDE